MTDHTSTTLTGGHPVRVVAASLLGTAIEWYEFFIYGTAAALVFPKVFFPDADPRVGVLLSLSTFAVAFLTRPIGGAIFGLLGDRLGRKPVLITTLALMGCSTLGIGLLPSHAAIGIAAPLLLVVLRVLQGLSLGGEYGGAVLMSVEHARPGRRGLFGALVNTGAGWGLLLANLAFLSISGLSQEALLSWGWRVPFWLSVILLGACLVVRLRISESPEFARAAARGQTRRTPLREVLTRHWRLALLMMLSYAGAGVVFYVGTVYVLTYGTDALGMSSGTMLTLVLLVNVLTIVAIPAFGALSDRVSRKRIFIVGAVGMAVLSPVWFLLLQTRSFAGMLAGFVLLFIPYAANYGVMPTFFAQVFPSTVRYSGLSLGYTLGTVISSAVAPLIATGLLSATGTWVAIAAYMSVVAVVSAVAAVGLREQPAAEPVAEGSPA
ncbi:MAG TPA: MFS transporter [Streptosporangiaceae bacterium]|jgi:MFS family permease